MALVYTTALAVVSLLPSGSAAPGGWDGVISPGLQNLLHVPAYAGLAILWLWAVPGRAGARAAWLAAALCAAYGAGLEFVQAFVPGRTGSILDVLLNAAGSAAGLLVMLVIPGGQGTGENGPSAMDVPEAPRT